MSYANLGELGTMQQSFHFEVTPAKKHCSNPAQASNCVCNAGGAGKTNPPDGVCQQWSEFNCPKLSKFCCPKGTIGRPKVYENGYRFMWSNPVQNLKPNPPCTGKPRPDSNISHLCENMNQKFEWTSICPGPNDPMRPPVF